MKVKTLKPHYHKCVVEDFNRNTYRYKGEVYECENEWGKKVIKLKLAEEVSEPKNKKAPQTKKKAISKK